MAYATYEITQNIFYTAIHVSVTVNIEQIKNICQKAMYKMPAGLSDFGITEKDAEDFYNWASKHVKGKSIGYKKEMRQFFQGNPKKIKIYLQSIVKNSSNKQGENYA